MTYSAYLENEVKEEAPSTWIPHSELAQHVDEWLIASGQSYLTPSHLLTSQNLLSVASSIMHPSSSQWAEAHMSGPPRLSQGGYMVG